LDYIGAKDDGGGGNNHGPTGAVLMGAPPIQKWSPNEVHHADILTEVYGRIPMLSAKRVPVVRIYV